jgi:formylglycine-generating enzyme required for sulfatase activity
MRTVLASLLAVFLVIGLASGALADKRIALIVTNGDYKGAPLASVVTGPCGGVATLAALSTRSAQPLSRDEECALKSGDEFRECADCPAMRVIPEGSFTMGSQSDEPGHHDDEGPQHGVTISKPFAASKFDVTFADWDACAAAGGCPKAADSRWGRGALPVINVGWDDAQVYVAWLAKTTGKPYRLLSEAEWEYAARAGTNSVYYWGGAISKRNADCTGCGGEWDGKGPSPVGSFRPNAFGLYDMAGNVWQWTQDCYYGNYDGAPADGSAVTTGDCGRRAMRGGSWNDVPRNIRAAVRDGDSTGERDEEVGFRVGRTLSP